MKDERGSCHVRSVLKVQKRSFQTYDQRDRSPNRYYRSFHPYKAQLAPTLRISSRF